MTRYRLQFLPQAKLEWDRLDGSIRSQFAKVLLRRLENPRVPAAALTSMSDCYKIKLRSAGFRLVYRVQDTELILLTIAVGKRDKLFKMPKFRSMRVGTPAVATHLLADPKHSFAAAAAMVSWRRDISSPSVSPTETLSDEGQHQRIERYALSFRPCSELHVHGAWQPSKDFAGG